MVEAEQLTLIGSKEPAQLLNEQRHVAGFIRLLDCLLESRSVRTQLLAPAQLEDALLDAPHARGDVLSLLLDVVQLLAVRSKLGSLQQLVKSLSRCVDEPDSLEHLASVDRAPHRALVLAHLFNECCELVPLRMLLVVVALVVQSGQPVARGGPFVSEVACGCAVRCRGGCVTSAVGGRPPGCVGRSGHEPRAYEPRAYTHDSTGRASCPPC